ncbi:MAG: CDP-glucose 4,6-dehydratase [Sphingomicrobium sp.]
MRRDFWTGRRVLVTGHTGFKGGWLALWLHQLGAKVTGFALPATDPSFFNQARLADLVTHVEGDIRDASAFETAIADARPELIFHLAAQSLVRASYADPVATYATNVMGTVHLLDACRRIDSVRAIVCVTSDKCYENRETATPYRETDPMGGHDPYSSSKGAAEIAIASFRRSYFVDGPLVASVRAGNVIGGGDWAEDRLVPDIVRAMLAGERPLIRNPQSIRPWQHVLDALSGYLLVGQRLLDGEDSVADAWNFGPTEDDTRPVAWVADACLRAWGAAGWDSPDVIQPHEATILKLDCSKARNLLGWAPRLSLTRALGLIADWHKGVASGTDARVLSIGQIQEFEALQDVRQASWA